MKVVFSGTLLRFVNYAKEVELEACNLYECIGKLGTQFPSLKPVLLNGDGGVRDTHQIFLNGEQVDRADVRNAADLRLGGGDTLLILTAIAGG